MSPQKILLLYVVVPLWLLAGFADWLCHRRSDIEHTSGPRESVFHLLLLAQMGIPLLGAIYLEANALVFGVLCIGFIAHELTTYADIRYASRLREVSVTEQCVHSVLEMSPLLVILLLASASWGQWLAVWGLGDEPRRLALVWSAEQPPAVYDVALALAVALLAVVPYLEELYRSRGTRRRGTHPVPR